jgi:hypothetical protein
MPGPATQDADIAAPSEPVDEPAVDSPDEPRDSPLARRLFALSVIAAIVPIIGAAIMAIRHRWVPVGDSAFLAIRARDVFSAHPPLIGMWSSASLISRIGFNNPGPLLYDVLAAPTLVFGSGGPGVFVGTALINIAAILGIAFVARRHGGALAGTIATATAAVLAWTLGSAVLLDPTQPNSMLLPFLLLLTLVWAASCRDLAAIPWAVFVASLIVQSHITYVYFVAVLFAWAAIVLVRWAWLVRKRDNDAWPALRRRLVRTSIVAVAVFIVCWIQPVIEQISNGHDGNLARMERSVRSGWSQLGFKEAARVVAQVVTIPPLWFRPSFDHFLSGGPDALPSAGIAIVTLLAVVVALGVILRIAYRRMDSTSARAAATALLALLAAWVTSARVPRGPFSETPHVFRWLWPVAAFVVFAVVLFVARRVSGQSNVLVIAGAAVAVVFSLLNLPQTDQGTLFAGTSTMPAVRDVGHQLSSLRDRGPFFADFGTERFADPYPSAILAQMQARSLGFVYTDEGLVVQLGTQRRFTGSNARERLVFFVGDDAVAAHDGARRVALHKGLDDAEQQELLALEAEIGPYVQGRGVALNERGQRAVRAGTIAPLDPAVVADPERLFATRALSRLITNDYLVLDQTWKAKFERYGALQKRWDAQTVGAFLTSLGDSPAAQTGTTSPPST